jgi:hypothetical protein
VTLEEMIQEAIDHGNTALAEQLKQLNPTNNNEIAKTEVKLTYKLEKFDGEVTENSVPVETIIIE